MMKEFTTKHIFFDLDQDSMKILSYPDLKTKIEQKLCCQICTVERCIGKISMEQKTYKLAIILFFLVNMDTTLPLHQSVLITEKLIPPTTSRSIFILFLQCRFLEKAFIPCPFFGLLGIPVSEGNYKVWKKIQDKVGLLQQSLAEQCCAENLQKEVEATIASGILPSVDG